MGTIKHVYNQTVADGTATSVVRPSDWNSAHAYTMLDAVSLSGNNTAGVMAAISSGTFYMAGSNLTLSQNANSITISGSTPPMNSHFGTWGFAATKLTDMVQSTSVAFSVFIPEPVSFSYMRIPIQMTTNSTSQATVASATATGSMDILSSWNIGVFTWNTGASSQSLALLQSTQNVWTIRHSVSMSNTSQMSYTQRLTGHAAGATFSRSTQYSQTQTRYDWSTSIVSDITGNRLFDIDFATSLSAGAYVFVVGVSSSAPTAGVGVSAASNCYAKFTGWYIQTQLNSVFAPMGATNSTSCGIHMGAGQISSTTNPVATQFDISQVSTVVANILMGFQLHNV